MDYLDLERIIQALMCTITIIMGISLALFIIIYEDTIRIAYASNINRESEYIFPLDKWINISG
jgi:hypothetical protein